ncbi:hypothetical protein [Petrimonas mucosa]|uniref:hypothetical protein n=1 Tax=Petrimonas mucosa TaxID=1642646 RepID=UPI001754986F|nr:hypothetical protein [Petrimonas mucosa]HHT28984.1 hypothetical protein [Petrimonas mucosa]
METIQQCTIRSGVQLPAEFYYRDETGGVMTAPLPCIGDGEHFLSLDDAIAAKEELLAYFDAVDQAIDLYGSEFVFRHFSLDFSILDAESGRLMLHFPYHRSFSSLHEMLNHWMDEGKEGELFFSFDGRELIVYRRKENICFSYRQDEKTREPGNKEISGTNEPEDLETEKLPVEFQTPARPFLNSFWRELFRAENFCRKVSKEYGSYENIWENRRLVPADIDRLLLSQNQMSFFLDVEDVYNLSQEGKYLTPSSKRLMIGGILKKGFLRAGDEIVCLDSTYLEICKCVVESLIRPPGDPDTDTCVEIVRQERPERIGIIVKDKELEDLDGVFYISKEG